MSTILCLIHGEQIKKAFTVQMNDGETISALKELIVSKNSNYFMGIDPRHLCLWKFGRSDLDNPTTLVLNDTDMLHPDWRVGGVNRSDTLYSEWGGRAPDPTGYIIIVKASKQGTYMYLLTMVIPFLTLMPSRQPRSSQSYNRLLPHPRRAV